MKTLLFLIIVFSYSILSLPVAVIPGFSDSCETYFFLTLIKVLKYNVYESAFCLKNKINDNISLEEKCKDACNEIKSHKEFENDFSILSMSQGGLIARYIIEKCDMKGKVKKLVSFGGPMMGTSQVPFCLAGVSCFIANSLVDYFVYNNYYQKNVGSAGYYRTAAHIDDFNDSKSILWKLNNPNPEEKNNFINLDSLVLIGFKNDKMISPKESAEFGVLDDNFNVLLMNETEEYKKDSFGLRTLNENNKIKIFYLEGGHLNFDFDDVLKYAVPNL